MNEYRNFCEFTKKPEKQPTFTKVILMTLYTLLTAGYVIFFWMMLRQWQLLLLLPFIMYAVIVLTWRYTKPEYEYSVEAGALTISVIYGGRTRRVRFTGDLTSATRISTYDERVGSARDILGVKDFSAGGEVWCGVFPDGNSGKKLVIVFSVNDEMKRALKICNPQAVVY